MADVCCRGCGGRGLRVALDLGSMPRSDGFLTEEALAAPLPRTPLRLGFCTGCGLAQLIETVPPVELFGPEYVYFGSVSADLRAHCDMLADHLVRREGLRPGDRVIEVASNDGYLLEHFARVGLDVLGIDPGPNQVAAARARGIPTIERFFDPALADEIVESGRRPRLIVANNVVAHVPAVHDFIAGLARLIDPSGLVSVEVPYVRDLVERGAFDTIYHEHVFYFSVASLRRLFGTHGLVLEDVERIPIHGGSIRLLFRPGGREGAAVARLLAEEEVLGIDRPAYYDALADRVAALCRRAGRVIDGIRAEGGRIAAYGAAAKGTILLNRLGLTREAIAYAVDRNPLKQGRYIPGTGIPIVAPERMRAEPPDYLLVLPWNFRDEIMRQEAEWHARGGRFIIPIPDFEIV